MARTPFDDVSAHWHKLVEDFHISPLTFYNRVEEELARRRIPGLKFSRIAWDEGGVLAPRREYLRVHGKDHIIDCCAAPFGTGSFFSSWTVKPKPEHLVEYAFLFLVIAAMGVWLAWVALLGLGRMGMPSEVVVPALIAVVPFAFVGAMFAFAIMAAAGVYPPERALLAVPIVGALYGRFFARFTYYRYDTMLMFHAAVHAALIEALNSVTTQKGLRALSHEDSKPIMHELVEALPVGAGD